MNGWEDLRTVDGWKDVAGYEGLYLISKNGEKESDDDGLTIKMEGKDGQIVFNFYGELWIKTIIKENGNVCFLHLFPERKWKILTYSRMFSNA